MSCASIFNTLQPEPSRDHNSPVAIRIRWTDKFHYPQQFEKKHSATLSVRKIASPPRMFKILSLFTLGPTSSLPNRHPERP
jgi:hypothetical protein